MQSEGIHDYELVHQVKSMGDVNQGTRMGSTNVKEHHRESSGHNRREHRPTRGHRDDKRGHVSQLINRKFDYFVFLKYVFVMRLSLR